MGVWKPVAGSSAANAYETVNGDRCCCPLDGIMDNRSKLKSAPLTAAHLFIMAANRCT